MASNYASVKLSGDFVDQARKEAEVVHRWSAPRWSTGPG